MEIISRKEAIEKGLKYYFTGKPCKRGHFSKRLISTCQCIDCKKEYYKTNFEKLTIMQKKRYKKNRDKILIKCKEYRENNPEKRKEMNRKYRENNPEKIKIVYKRWYHNNIEKSRASSLKWYYNNQEKCRENSLRWRNNNLERCRQNSLKWNKNNPKKYKENSVKYRRNNLYKTRFWNSLHRRGLKVTYKDKFVVLVLRLYELFSRQMITQSQAAKYFERIENKDESVIKEIFNIKLQ